jgi:hypothetical protein
MQSCEVCYPNDGPQVNIATGDSHAISMYRPGWKVNSVPFKTLHGALKQGLVTFIELDKFIKPIKEVEFYFGNIDVRHHILRQPDPVKATKDLVKEYFKQAQAIVDNNDVNVKIYELLPIEDESRSVPKTGYFKDTPFYGTREERNKIRLLFKEECLKKVNPRIQLFQWVDKLTNSNGELGFEFMEKPKSIHMSREFYPHWNGKEFNDLKPREINTTIAESTGSPLDILFA